MIPPFFNQQYVLVVINRSDFWNEFKVPAAQANCHAWFQFEKKIYIYIYCTVKLWKLITELKLQENIHRGNFGTRVLSFSGPSLATGAEWERTLRTRLRCSGCSKLIIWFRAYTSLDFLATSWPITNQVIKLWIWHKWEASNQVCKTMS